MSTRTEEAYWLGLIRAPGVGPINFFRLVKRFGSPQAVFEGSLPEFRALKLKEELIDYLQNPLWHLVDNDLRWLAQPNNHLLKFSDANYPARLLQIHDPPPLLFVHGDCQLLASGQLGMVGTRNSSPHGEQIAREFAESLSHAGLTITSGLALGIDAASHRGALAGTGKTIAVTGTGLDRVYPPQHRDLAHQIAAVGALVSEFPPGTPAKAANFPRRNRIISGLSVGILVVEADRTSGALLTAQHALEQGRDIFAIPGSIHNPVSRGCHALIKEGAILVDTVADIVKELSIHLPSPNPLTQTGRITTPITSIIQPIGLIPHDLDPEYTRLLEHLGTKSTSIDNLVELSGLTAEAVSSMLLILELRGLVISQAGGLYARHG